MRRFALFLIALTALAATSRLQAELVWTPGQGWSIQGGALAGLTGEEGRDALDLMNRARTAEERGDVREAIKLYERTSKRYPNSIYASEALYRTALLREKRKEYFKAFDSFQQLLVRYPNSEKFSTVVGEQYRLASRLAEGQRSYIWGLFPGFKNREKAIEYYEQIVANAPYSDYAPLSLMNIARGYQRMGSTAEAIDALDRMINAYPRNVLTPDAYLKLAETHSSLVDGPYYDQASTKQAITYYEDFLIQFPGDAGAADAEKGLNEMKEVLAESKIILADYYYKYRRNYKAARVFYNEAITTFPDSQVAQRARTMLQDVDARLAGEAPPPVQDAPKQEPKKRKRFLLF
jgi:outer membrane protein assembly factor BamD